MTTAASSGMTRITLSFLLSLLNDNFPGLNSPAHTKHHWTYKGPEGPSNWPLHYEHCAGVRQSPIDIVPTETVFSPDLGNFHLENFNSYSQAHGPTLLNITNNGHAASVRVTSNMRVSGGGLRGSYKTAEFHFHWGSTDDVGSEHALYGRKFPLEMHIVNYAEKYGNIKEAMTQPDGLAVLGVLFELSDKDNPDFNALDNALRVVHKAGEHNLVERLRLRYLLPKDTSKYWRYLGSLTTPFCFESVIWTVFAEPQKISRTQLETLRSLLHEDEHDFAIMGSNSPTPSRLVDNWRPIQELNGRTVFRSFDDIDVRRNTANQMSRNEAERQDATSHANFASPIEALRNAMFPSRNSEPTVASPIDELRNAMFPSRNSEPTLASPIDELRNAMFPSRNSEPTLASPIDELRNAMFPSRNSESTLASPIDELRNAMFPSRNSEPNVDSSLVKTSGRAQSRTVSVRNRLQDMPQLNNQSFSENTQTTKHPPTDQGGGNGVNVNTGGSHLTKPSQPRASYRSPSKTGPTGLSAASNPSGQMPRLSSNQGQTMTSVETRSGTGNTASRVLGTLPTQRNIKTGVRPSSLDTNQGNMPSNMNRNALVQGQRQHVNIPDGNQLSNQQSSVDDRLELSLTPNGTAKSRPPVMQTNSISRQQAARQQQVGSDIRPTLATRNQGLSSTGSAFKEPTRLQHILKTRPAQRGGSLNNVQTPQHLQFRQHQQQPPQSTKQAQQQQAVYRQQFPQQRNIKATDSQFPYQIIQKPYSPLLQQFILQQRQKQQQQRSQPPVAFRYKQQPQNSLKGNIQIIRQLSQNTNQISAGRYQQHPTRYAYQTQQQRVDTRPPASSQLLRSFREKLSASDQTKNAPQTLNSAAARIQSGKGSNHNAVQSASRAGNRPPSTIIRNVNGRVIASRPQSVSQSQQNVQLNSGGIVQSRLRQPNRPTVRITPTNQRPSIVGGARMSLVHGSAQPPLVQSQARYGSKQGLASTQTKVSPGVFLSQPPTGQKYASASGISSNSPPADEVPYVFLHRLQQPVRIRRPYYEKLYNLQGHPHHVSSSSSSFSSFPSSSSGRQISAQQLLSFHPSIGEFNEFR